MATGPVNEAPYRLIDHIAFGENVVVHPFTNLYGCTIGDTNCRIQSHAFICDGVTIEDRVFIGHRFMFINDTCPHATTSNGGLQTHADWELLLTRIRQGSTISPGVVTRNVASDKVVAGMPARVLERRR